MKKFLILAAIAFAFCMNSSAQAAPALGSADPNWKSEIDAAAKRNDPKQINIIAASHPEAQGQIAVQLLEISQAEKGNIRHQVDIFKTATPFVGRVQPAEAGRAAEVISATTRIAADPAFQKSHPREAGEIFLSALLMSSQPNIVANYPNLHAEVLEAADDFIKGHPQDADKRLMEEVSLAQAGGAPETPPRGVINPSAE